MRGWCTAWRGRRRSASARRRTRRASSRRLSSTRSAYSTRAPAAPPSQAPPPSAPRLAWPSSRARRRRRTARLSRPCIACGFPAPHRGWWAAWARRALCRSACYHRGPASPPSAHRGRPCLRRRTPSCPGPTRASKAHSGRGGVGRRPAWLPKDVRCPICPRMARRASSRRRLAAGSPWGRHGGRRPGRAGDKTARPGRWTRAGRAAGRPPLGGDGGSRAGGFWGMGRKGVALRPW
mmetsp:Transcript_5459/g.17174  ORF Transcript_5459/g.17174 Transcript_5459/m.17174 type:complete len:236 (+) Transcript_5459:913-1620(+)